MKDHQSCQSSGVKRKRSDNPESILTPVPGPSGLSRHNNVFNTNNDDSSDDDEDHKDFDREALLREINADINHIISSGSKKEELKPKKEESLKADIASNYRGKDGALYTFEIFMRDKNNCRTKKDRPGKADPRAPIIYNSNGVANAIIPANHKLMLLATRIATHPRQFVKRGNYVLFKFFVDGEALSEVGIIMFFFKLEIILFSGYFTRSIDQ